MRRLTKLFFPATLLAVAIAATSCGAPRPYVDEQTGILVCDATLDFGSVTRSSEVIATATCRNDGTAPLGMSLGAIVQPLPPVSDPAYAPFRFVSPDDAVGHHELPPGVAWEIRVAFLPTEVGLHSGHIPFTTDRTRESCQIILVGIGLADGATVREPCAAVYNSTIDFGTVEKNQYALGVLTILNDRDPNDPIVAANTDRYSCDVSDMRFAEGTDREFRFEDVTAEMFPGELGITLPPGGRANVPIVFAPTTDGLRSGAVTFSISNLDPATPQPLVVSLAGIGRSSCLEVLPRKIQFGTIRMGCQSRERGASARNSCGYPVRLVGVPTISAIGGAPFTIAPPAADYPLAPGAQLDLKIRYRPETIGEDAGTLSILWMDGDVQKTMTVALEGTGGESVLLTETFPIPGRAKIDTLFVIDNSISMVEKQQALATNFDSFIRVVAEDNVDFHIAVTTTDPTIEQGRFVPVSGTQDQRILTRALGAAVKTQFMSNVMGVGTSGSDSESLIWPAYNALRDPLLTGANAGFLRQDARLNIVVVSDAADLDPNDNPVSLYERFFRTIKGVDSLNGLRFSAIIPTQESPPAGCAYDEPDAGRSPRVKSLALALNGMVDEICNADWSQTLISLSRDVFSQALAYALMYLPDPATIKVYINGEPIDPVNPSPPYYQIWTYDSMGNAIVFQETTAPAPGQTLVIEYAPACIETTP